MEKRVDEQEEKDAEIIIDLLKRLFPNPQIVRTKGYCRHDLEMTCKGVEYVIEIKSRDYNSTDFSKWILEEDKYTALMQFPKKRKIYANIFKDKKVYIWNIENCKMDKEEKSLPRNYFGDKKKKTKVIYYLYNKDAKKYLI